MSRYDNEIWKNPINILNEPKSSLPMNDYLNIEKIYTGMWGK